MGLVCSRSQADIVSIQVTDQLGAPVADAVILGPPGYRPVDPASALKQAPAIMDQINKTFVPNVLTIEQGNRVNFPNSDDIRHHVYSFSTPKMFELKLYAKQPDNPIPFEKAGIVVLGCNIHDNMIGYIVVSDTQSWAQTDDSGNASLDLPTDNSIVRLWHPQLASGFTQAVEMQIPAGEAGSPKMLKLDLKTQPKPESTRGFGSDRFRSHGR